MANTRLDERTAEFVTVIMPIRNEADFIARSLSAVLAQEYPHAQLEVLIADGMSTDSTRSIISSLSADYPDIALHIIDNPGSIVPTGLNLAIKRARGEIIIRVDGHTIIAPNYITECVEALRRTDADNVGGRMDAVSTTPIGKAIALATSSPFGVGGSRFHYSTQEEWVDTVYMGAWRKNLFERIGFFDEELVRNQDDEFNYRLRAHTGKILLSNRIRSQYFNRASFKALWRQYFQYGYWKVRVMQKHPRQMQFRQFIPPLFVAVAIGGAILAPFSKVFLVLWLLALIAYGTVNIGISWRMAQQQGREYLRWLPLIFATLHFAYGTGFWRGMLRFIRKWGTS